MKYIPDSIYELLPYLYILAGIMVMIGIPGQLGKLSGLLLAAAGVLVFKWRLEHRSMARSPVRYR